MLRAVAVEGCVKAPQLGTFTARHGLHAANGVKTTLKMLVEKELLYPGRGGYAFYDRLLAEYLRALPPRRGKMPHPRKQRTTYG